MEDVANLLSAPSTAEEALRLLKDRCASNPTDPRALFELANAYDFLDLEREAEEAYRGVERLGLEKLTAEDRARWYIQFGSTLRLLGRYDLSRQVLARGEKAFPDNQAISAFLALTELATGQPEQAARVLLTATLRSSNRDIEYYRQALTRYVEGLVR